MRLALGVALLLVVRGAEAQQVQLLDPGMFGLRTVDSITPLYEKKADEVEPYIVKLDIRCGSYHAATVSYPVAVGFDDVRASLNALYGEYEMPDQLIPGEAAIWRVTDQKFTVSLGISAQTETAQVIYISQTPSDCADPPPYETVPW